MSKKIQIGAKPTAQAATGADEWVENRAAAGATAEAAEPMKRLTIDVPESLHRLIKTTCAQRGTKIADEVRDLLIRNFVNQ